MVSEFLLDIVFNIVSGMFGLLPDLSWSVDTSAFDYLTSFIACIAYLLPWDTVQAIVALIFTITVIRIVIAGIKVLWDILPLV